MHIYPSVKVTDIQGHWLPRSLSSMTIDYQGHWHSWALIVKVIDVQGHWLSRSLTSRVIDSHVMVTDIESRQLIVFMEWTKAFKKLQIWVWGKCQIIAFRHHCILMEYDNRHQSYRWRRCNCATYIYVGGASIYICINDIHIHLEESDWLKHLKVAFVLPNK